MKAAGEVDGPEAGRPGLRLVSRRQARLRRRSQIRARRGSSSYLGGKAQGEVAVIRGARRWRQQPGTQLSFRTGVIRPDPLLASVS